MHHVIKSLIAAILTSAASAASAIPITDPALLGTNRKTIDFSEFDSSYPHLELAGTASAFTFTSGPIQIGTAVGVDVIWSTSNPMSVIGNSDYQLIDQGNWNFGRNGFTGSNGRSDSMSYAFATPVRGVGGFINYIVASGITTYSDVMLSVFDGSDVLLESFNVTASSPIATVQDNTGAFRGILRNAADIRRFEVKNAGVVLDDLQFTSRAVPEPAVLALVGLGLAGIGFQRRNRA